MIPTGKLRGLALALLSCLSLAANASAQITTGTVAGTIKDAQGGVIPGATVVLISETRGTKSAPVVTNETGDYVFPNVTPDTYTVEVTMEGFKTAAPHGRAGQRRRPCRRAGDSTLEVGGTAETVNVTRGSGAGAVAERRALLRRHDRRRSRTCRSTAANFTSLTSLTPGVVRTARRPAARGSAAPARTTS